MFRAELAFELKQLGYDIVKTGQQGLFEIAGISQQAIHTYSQRRQQIEAYLQERGFSGAKAAVVATLKTRHPKHHVNRATLTELWQVRGQMHGVDAFQEAQQVVTAAHQPEQSKTPVDSPYLPLAKAAIEYAIDHLVQVCSRLGH